MRFLFSAVLCLFSISAVCQSTTDSLLSVLNAEIDNREVYLEEKVAKIDQLKSQAAARQGTERFDIYLKIYDEYKSFIYDSAFHSVKPRPDPLIIRGRSGISSANA